MYQIKRHYDRWNILVLKRDDKPDKELPPSAAAMLEARLTDETLFYNLSAGDGRLFVPLTQRQRKARRAQLKRNARRRQMTAAGLTERHGWSGHWQRR